MPENPKREASIQNADHPSARGALASPASQTPARAKIEADAFLAAIVESSDDAIISKDLHGVITSWNKGAERIFGYSPKEVIGQSISILIPPERLEEERGILQRICKGEHIDHYETVRRRKDGSLVDISLTVSPIKDSSGKIIGASKIARDITDRRRDQEKLKQSEERFRVTLGSIGDAVIATDTQGRVTFMNAVAERLTGWRLQDALSLPLENSFRIINELNRQPVENPVTRVLREGALVGLGNHAILIAKDGTERPVDDSAAPIRGPTGELTGVVLVFRDVTAQRAGRETATQLRLAIEAAPNGMVMVNAHGIITMVNAQMERLFGYGRTEMLGQPVELLLPDRYRASHPGQRHGFFASPQARAMGQGRDLYARRKDGSEFPVEVGLNPAETPEGRFVLAAVIDITQRKRMEQELAKAHADLEGYARKLEAMVAERTAHLQQTIAELESVSYSLSHDMRAPLRTIQGFSQIVLSEAGEKLSPTETELLTKIISAASRLDRLIQDVLTYTRVSRESVTLSTVNVEQLLRQIIDERPELQSPKAEIAIESPLEPMTGHEASLTQCITNLLDNAVKFVRADQQPRVRIWTEIASDHVRLWFEDNGVGIPKGAQERVFGIFQRVHDEKTYPGTGIGLAIVRKAVERMGGTLGVESEPGRGSRFWVQLPRGK